MRVLICPFLLLELNLFCVCAHVFVCECVCLCLCACGCVFLCLSVFCLCRFVCQACMRTCVLLHVRACVRDSIVFLSLSSSFAVSLCMCSCMFFLLDFVNLLLFSFSSRVVN